MAPKNPLSIGDRQHDGERMVLSQDASALRRGRRTAPRTQVLRPALLWEANNPDAPLQCVVLDLNPHGMKLRSLEQLPEGTRAVVQLMRDEAFTMPLSQPLNVEVVRVTEVVEGFHDHGVRVLQVPIKKSASQPAVNLPRPVSPRRGPARMHTAELRNPNRTR